MAYNISLLFHDYYFQVKNIKNKNKNKLFSAETPTVSPTMAAMLHSRMIASSSQDPFSFIIQAIVSN